MKSKIIGVTGGVGTGKSTILNILANEYHAAVIMADDVSRELMMPGESCYEAVTKYFGDSILTEGPGSDIDRAKLALIVFNDAEKLKMLNSINHPLVRKKIEKLTEEYKENNYPMIIIETAILIEAGYLDMLDELWVIHTDLDVRIERLKSSRGYSEEKIMSIIGNQMPFEKMAEYADLIIENSKDLNIAREQINNHLKNAGNTDK